MMLVCLRLGADPTAPHYMRGYPALTAASVGYHPNHRRNWDPQEPLSGPKNI
jgi:hypothetical protein